MGERLDVLDQRRPAEVADLAREGRLEAAASRAAPPSTRASRSPRPRCTRRRRSTSSSVSPSSSPAARNSSSAAAAARAGRRVLLAEVDVALGRVERPHREHRRLDHEVRPELHDVAVLDRPRLALVRRSRRRSAAPARARPPPTSPRSGTRRRRIRSAPTPSAPRRSARASGARAGARARRGPRSRRASRRPRPSPTAGPSFVECVTAGTISSPRVMRRGEVAVAETGDLDRAGRRSRRSRAPKQSQTGPVQTRTASVGTCRNE